MRVGKRLIDLSTTSWTEVQAEQKVFAEIDFGVQKKFWSGGARLIRSCY